MIIGLTGGPGAGKTLAARFLEEEGAVVISGDEAGKKVLEKYPSTLKKLKMIFGESIMDDRGRLDRRKLGRKVFANPKALRKLNEIIHPYLLKILRAEIRRHKARWPHGLIVVDAALIYEWGIEDWFDRVLVVTGNRNNRIERLIRSGLTRKEAENRIASQISQRKKAAMPDFVIENNGKKSELKKKVLRFLNGLNGHR